MERAELHSRLEQKMNECWNDYMDRLLLLPPIQIIGKAAEIAAARSIWWALTIRWRCCGSGGWMSTAGTRALMWNMCCGPYGTMAPIRTRRPGWTE